MHYEVLEVHTNDRIQSQWTLSKDLFVACDCRSFLNSFPVQVGQHHVDLRLMSREHRYFISWSKTLHLISR